MSDLLVIVLSMLGYLAVRLALCGAFRKVRSPFKRSGAIALHIPPGPKFSDSEPLVMPELVSLCESCVFSHVVRGRASAEAIILCGYAFPLRDIPFVVRECSDFKAKRSEKPEGESETPTLEAEAPVAVGFRAAIGGRNSFGGASINEDEPSDN